MSDLTPEQEQALLWVVPPQQLPCPGCGDESYPWVHKLWCPNMEKAS